ncbi:MAG: radical SAM protein, partial [Paludibacteraceae bacterium]|nr:radical SAM protein [Paludibacteraceae bacterium]
MLFDRIVYGPIHSRRLGNSLGINLMPTTDKLCTFDCIYCECGFNQPVLHPHLPTRQEVKTALEQFLLAYTAEEKNAPLDVITFSGNGEPTLHPEFLGIIEDTCALRNRYCPQAKV